MYPNIGSLYLGHWAGGGQVDQRGKEKDPVPPVS